MKVIPTSQLLVNDKGAIYHLGLRPDQLADNVILVGDPKRVETVSSFFEKIEYKVSNREMVTHTGYFNGERISVLSTGMGTDNLDIVVNELDALVNIDLKKRVPKEKHHALNLVRLGTSGALQPDIAVGDFVASRFAVGLDGLLYFYEKYIEVLDRQMTDRFIKHMNYPKNLPCPYVVASSDTLFEKLSEGCHHGITATSPGFYGPQGRVLRLALAHESINHDIETFAYDNWKVCNFEMESSALFGLGRMLGHNTLTICVAIANRVTEQFLDDYHPQVKLLIQQTLERLTAK
ncbi:MAG: nucleoside phosphorylase [Lentimicrobiaceae bacterium]|jgi:uridine phosphorylase|nr:nucleoside phosphorylase [Lentimicrobiaceae bacterium]